MQEGTEQGGYILGFVCPCDSSAANFATVVAAVTTGQVQISSDRP